MKKELDSTMSETRKARHNKAKLAFEMLEKEMETLTRIQASEILAGDGLSGYYLPNGYCVFNCISYIFNNGSTGNAQYYVGQFESYYGNTAQYSSTGELLGYSMTGNQLMTMLESNLEGSGASFGVVYLSSTGITNSLTGGASVMAILPNAGPNGEMHAVIITEVNTDGTFTYYDPTAGNTVSNYSGNISMAFSVYRPL